MSSPLTRSSKPQHISPFFRDLASPIAVHHRSSGRFASPGSGAGLPWRDRAGDVAGDPPPPPVFTLDDRAEHTPEPLIGDLPSPPGSPPGSKSRTPLSSRFDRKGSISPSASPSLASSSFVMRGRGEGSGSVVVGNGGWKSPESSSSWMATLRVGGEEREKRAGSPVDGVVEHGVVMALSRAGDVARLELPRSGVGNGSDEMETWITVFGFAPGDTNLVLREFEKCGVILKHIPGPRVANWIHILYKNHYDAQKAINKNGMQLNNLLVIGVKPVDPVHQQHLNDILNNHGGGFIPSKLTTLNSSSATSSSETLPHSYHPHTSTTAITDSGRRPAGAIATPARSLVSKVMDLMFGI